MSKAKLQDAARELVENTDEVLLEAKETKGIAEKLMQSLKKVENQFAVQEQQRKALEKQKEEEALLKQHAKAWTMPDDELLAAQEAENQGKEDAKPVETTAVKEKSPPADAAAEKQAPANKLEKSEPAPTDEQAVEKREKVQVKSETQTVEAKPLVKAPQAGEQKAEKAPAPAQQRPAAPGAPMQRRAGDGSAPRPMNRPQQDGPRPPYGRPANPQQGQQRPAGPYGRLANPQQGQPRPAGPYGRPANPQQQGQAGPYGRRPGGAVPGGPRPQGGAPYGRPAQSGGDQNRGFQPRQGSPGGQRMGGPGQPQRTKAADITPFVEKERVSNYDPNKKNYVRQYDPERSTKNKKQLAREQRFSSYDDDRSLRGRKRGGKKKVSVQQTMAPIKIEKAVMTAETITVKDLTERIGKPAGDILKKLLLLGVVANINSELDYDTAALVSSEFDVELELKMDKTAEDYLLEEDFEDDEEDLETRPPVVTIMGHVDHGKTSLLDYIRNAKVTSSEAGGITQHIGAYTVDLEGRKITFLDTPGHEAFTAMRARGAQATDIAILVVAADDGVMPQTIEAINHAKAADVPIIVAVNKMDKATANPDRVKQELTTHGLVPEEWGGDTIIAPVSALTGDGVDELLEMILLVADVQQLKANPDRLARGIVIEAKLDKARGPLATVLVQNGTLRVGDNIVAGVASGRVRAMLNDRGERVDEAGPSIPVEIAGFGDVPSAGDEMMAVGADHLSRQVAQERRDKQKAARIATSKVTLDNLFSTIDAGKLVNLNLIVKADVQGSVEAVKQALEKLSTDEVKIRILHSGVGAITQDDVNLASAFNAIIIGFNIRPDAGARDLAEKEDIDIRLYRVIYQAIEDIEKAMKGLLEPEYKEVLLGHAVVRNTFKITGTGTVAGCYVQDGKMVRNALVRLLRDNVVIFEGKLSSLKRFKDDAKEVAAGYECGISLEGYNDIKENDVIECYNMEEIER